MIRTVLAMTAVAFAVSAVIAQGDPIAQRKAIMKSNGQQNRVATDMLENKTPFDLAAAKKVFTTFEDAAKLKDLYPENSKTGGDTQALPAIWENKADFDAKLAKLSSDAKAQDAGVKDLDSFKAAMGEVGKNCGGCHNTYRKKAS